MKSMLSILLVMGMSLSGLLSCGELQKNIKVSFKVDDDVKPISDSFKIYLTHGIDTIKAAVNKETTFIPDLKDSIYTLVFEYKDEKLVFDSMHRNQILPEVKVGWNFGIENRPFSQVRGLLSADEYQTDTVTKQLYYLQFDPEGMDGIQIVKKRK
jgi:hypothetical protein